MKKLFTLIAIAFAVLNASAQQSWNFSNLSATDIANLDADATNWSNDASNYRYANTASYLPSNEVLKANGQELEITKGLKFKASTKDKIRLSYKNNYKVLVLNAANLTITIPNLKKGQKIEVVVKTASSGNARGLYATNVTPDGNSFSEAAKDGSNKVTHTGTITASGDVVLSTDDGGLAFYSIAITGNGEDITYSSESRSWNFLTISSADETALAADATNWTHEETSSDNRYNNNAVYGGTNITLEANGTELEYTKGLQFTFAKQANKIRLNWNKATSGLQLNGKDIVLTIPNLAKGTKISMSVRTAKSGESHGFTAGNFTADSGVELSGDAAWTISGEATENGSVTFTTTLAMNVISLAVGDAATGTNTVAANTTIGKQDGKTYNLAGMEVRNPGKGIYIKDGKKYVSNK